MNSRIRHIYMTDDDADDYYLFSVALKEVDPSVKISWFDTCDKMIQQLDSCEEQPDLIVLDLNVPGNHGQSCLVITKQHPCGQNVPVIIFSTSSSPAAIATAHKNGAYSYVVKPVTMEELKQTVKEMLAIPPPI